MAIRERLIYAIDIVTDKAKTGLAGFKKSVQDAEGATGKFKAGTTSAFDTIKANAAGLALGAGTALVAFGAKSVQAFTEGALAAGKFADASGLAVEDASRWQEVAGDLGVSTKSIETGVIRMEKAIGSNVGAVQELGIEMQRLDDGTVDVNATMLHTIERLDQVEDPIKRAQLASEIFGRGFAEMGEIVMGDADEIKKRLEGVADAQVFDGDEVEKARRFRDAMADLQDAATEVSLVVGEALVPAVTDFAEGITEVREAMDSLPGVPKALKWWWENISPQGIVRKTYQAEKAIVNFGKGMLGMGSDAKEATPAVDDLVESLQDGTAAAKVVASAMDEARDAQLRQKETIHALKEEQRDYVDFLEGRAVEAEQEARDAKIRHKETIFALKEQERDYIDFLEGRALGAVEAITEATARDREERELLVEAMEDQRLKALELIGGDIAVRETQRAAEDAAAELTNVLADQETTLRDAGAAIDDTAAKYINAAQTAADYRADQLEANGQTVDATIQARLLKEELQRLAGQTTGPLHDALMGLIDDINAIPKNTAVNIVLNRNVSGDAGGVSFRGARARGGRTYPGFHEVLEEGPELLQQDGKTYLMSQGGGNVIPLDQTPSNGPLPDGVGGTTARIINVNFYTPKLSPEDVVDAIRKYDRRNTR